MTIIQARNIVGNQQGLPSSFDGSIAAYAALSPAQQLDLTRGVLDYIINNQPEFTDAQIATAYAQRGQAQSMRIEDTSFDAKLFLTELEKNAYDVIVKPIQNLGDSVSGTANFLAKALPFIVLGALALMALPYIKKQTST